MGAASGQVIGTQIKEAVESGRYIPEFYLQEKHVDARTGQETKTSALVVRIFTAFENALVQPGSRTLLEIARQELLPQNEQTRAMRKTWYQRKAAGCSRPGLEELDRIDGLVKLDASKEND